MIGDERVAHVVLPEVGRRNLTRPLRLWAPAVEVEVDGRTIAELGILHAERLIIRDREDVRRRFGSAIARSEHLRFVGRVLERERLQLPVVVEVDVAALRADATEDAEVVKLRPRLGIEDLELEDERVLAAVEDDARSLETKLLPSCWRCLLARMCCRER